MHTPLRSAKPARRVLGIAAAVALLTPQAAFTQQPPIDLELARAYFRDAERLSRLDGGELWGVELYGPLLFAEPASRFVVGNMADSA